MDILIIKPGFQKGVFGDLDDFELTAIEPPLWGAILAGYLRKLGYGVGMVDLEIDPLPDRINAPLVMISVSGHNPSASTIYMDETIRLADVIKQQNPEVKIIVHGIHPSALPAQIVIEPNIDFVCQGEGFETLPALINMLREEGEIGSLPGLWYNPKGVFRIIGPNPPPLLDLSLLPMPAWDLLPMTKYRDHNWHCFDDIQNRSPYVAIYTSLGCPYNCSFCNTNSLFGKSGIRYRPVSAVIDEIDFLVKNYGIRNIKIADELFCLKEDRVVAICDQIIERGYDLNMWAYARIDTITILMLEKMKKAGFNLVSYGIESGSKRVLQQTHKQYNPNLVMNVVKMTRDAGLIPQGNFIFGLPEDDFDSMQQTLEMAFTTETEWPNFYVAMAYPGSRLYTETDPSVLPVKWSGYSQYSYDCQPLPTKYLPPADVLAFRDYAFHTYFENPRYLDMMQDKFGSDIVNHIKDMTKIKLKRKLLGD